MKKVSMQDIATQLGISKMTVSKCFKNSEDISEDTKQTILRTAREMGYEYKRRIKYRIAVLFSEVYFEPNEKFYNGLYKRLQELEWVNSMKLSLFYVSREDERNHVMNKGVEDNDAIMLMGQFSKKYVLYLLGKGKPVVCLDFGYRGVEADSVISDSFQASYNLTSHMIEMGHRKIAFVGNLNYTNSVNDRYLGYYKALLEEGIDMTPRYRIDDRDERGILDRFELPEDMPTAFVCNNDHAAYLLIRQLKKEGFRVPEEVSVAGFDDVLYSEISDPPITSVHVQRRFMAEQAVLLMKRRFQQPDARPRTITIDCSIRYRESIFPIDKSN
ncbi:MAG: LacI family DNA-binding transcriptional regulator [bacterium]|nr:LacI family DNA-binding transcriptional regulator [bacterium]